MAFRARDEIARSTSFSGAVMSSSAVESLDWMLGALTRPATLRCAWDSSESTMSGSILMVNTLSFRPRTKAAQASSAAFRSAAA